jgi:hypothetical protein
LILQDFSIPNKLADAARAYARNEIEQPSAVYLTLAVNASSTRRHCAWCTLMKALTSDGDIGLTKAPHSVRCVDAVEPKRQPTKARSESSSRPALPGWVLSALLDGMLDGFAIRNMASTNGQRSKSYQKGVFDIECGIVRASQGKKKVTKRLIETMLHGWLSRDDQPPQKTQPRASRR